MATLFLMVNNSLSAQQIFSISQYIQHNYIYNPAAAGANEQTSVGATYKQMWSGIEGGPLTTILFGDKYFNNIKTGLGVLLYKDVTGIISRTGGDVNFSYSINFANKKRLMFGVAGQFIQESIDKAQVEKYIPGDPLLSGPGSYFTGDAAAGIYYTSSTINFGVSAKQLVQSKLDFVKTSTMEEGRLYRHYFLMGSYNWKTDEENIIVPNFIVKLCSHAPVDIEAGCRIEHKDLIWGGFNFHYKQDFSAFAGIKLNHKFAIGYAFDQYKTPLSIFAAGGDAHELMLRYYFTKN